MKMKDGFILHCSHFSAISMLSNEQLGKLLRSVYMWRITGEEPDESDATVMMAFKFIANQIIIDMEKYNEKCERNKQSARHRWGSTKVDAEACERMRTDAEACERMRTDAEACERMRTDAEACERMRTDANDANNDNNNNNNNDLLGGMGETIPNTKKRRRFIVPTKDEIHKYCIEKGIMINEEDFMDFYESKGWKIGKNPMASWKATVNRWARNNPNRTMCNPTPVTTNKNDLI